MAKSGFVPHGERWPDWASLVYGIGGGYQCFEDAGEGEAWYAEWKKANPPAERKPAASAETEDDGELKRTGRIGFAA